MILQDSGFLLSKLEIYNWGNFHGWQKFDLTGDDAYMGMLLSVKPHSMICGINGSGKSTLIDAIMVTLLPFEGSTKLGVTHDHESGGSGGRKVNDYVLGKYSSHDDGGQVSALSSIYGRQEGTSIIILTFRHRGDPKRVITVGRLWWYQNHKVKTQNMLFLAHQNLSIGKNDNSKNHLADHEGRPFASAREFKKGMMNKKLRIQIFDKNQAYFQSLSLVFGDLKREDLKLLNQAFYVKSIGQIDSFIRQNMLLENKNEFVVRLIDSVKKAKEITFDIEICEKKLISCEKIVTELTRYHKSIEKKIIYDKNIRLISIYHDWSEFQKTEKTIVEKKGEVIKGREMLPKITKKIDDLTYEHGVHKTKLDGNQVALEIENYRRELQNYGRELAYKKENKNRVEVLAKALELCLPKDEQRLDEFKGRYLTLEQKNKDKESNLDEKKAQYTLDKIQIEKNCNEIKDELQFLSTHKTLIPEYIYAIKERCAHDLGLPKNALLFVGELIAMKRGQQKYRKAVEAALAPISKNLLCHPDHLDKVTSWINQNRLKGSVTIKRIAEEDLYIYNPQSFDASSILKKINILDEKDNPFNKYLWNWLGNHFYHLILEEKYFKKNIKKAVTCEGLVKLDNRTMRKYKERFEYCLGWDTQERQSELISKLQNENKKNSQIKVELQGLQDGLDKLRKQRGHIDQLKEARYNFFDIKNVEIKITRINELISKLRQKNQDYLQLKEKVQQIEKLLEVKKTQKFEILGGINTCEKVILDMDKQNKQRQKDIDHFINAPFGSANLSLIELHENKEQVNELLNKLASRLQKDKITHHEYRDQLNLLRDNAEKSLQKNQSVVFLADYKRIYEDPNLHYHIENDQDVVRLIKDWQRLKIEIETTGLPKVKKKWIDFFNNTLLESVKSSINQIRVDQNSIKSNIDSINRVLHLTNFENLPQEKRYLKIESINSRDERIKKFLRDIRNVEKTISSEMRILDSATSSKEAMKVLEPFVQKLQDDNNYRDLVVDVRNHYSFNVHSLRRSNGPKSEDQLVEIFTGAKRDAKSSAQTTQLAYALLASSLAYRFHFNDPDKGKNTLRLIVLDEFGGKFDNERPRDILKLLDSMGFQAILVTPMSKVELLAQYTSKIVFVHKGSSSHSRVEGYSPLSLEEYKKAYQKLEITDVRKERQEKDIEENRLQ